MRKSRTDTEFGAVVSKNLTTASWTQLDLANNTGASLAYMNQMMTGRRRPSAEWADLIADTMRLSDRQRVQLHRAAARDVGFKLDLRK